MALKTVTLHMYESTAKYDAGRRYLSECDFRETEFMKDRIWLAQQDVEIDWPEIDTRQLQIDALQAEIQRERADSQVRVNLLLERISKLQCLAHEVDV